MCTYILFISNPQFSSKSMDFDISLYFKALNPDRAVAPPNNFRRVVGGQAVILPHQIMPLKISSLIFIKKNYQVIRRQEYIKERLSFSKNTKSIHVWRGREVLRSSKRGIAKKYC